MTEATQTRAANFCRTHVVVLGIPVALPAPPDEETRRSSVEARDGDKIVTLIRADDSWGVKVEVTLQERLRADYRSSLVIEAVRDELDDAIADIHAAAGQAIRSLRWEALTPHGVPYVPGVEWYQAARGKLHMFDETRGPTSVSACGQVYHSKRAGRRNRARRVHAPDTPVCRRCRTKFEKEHLQP